MHIYTNTSIKIKDKKSQKKTFELLLKIYYKYTIVKKGDREKCTLKRTLV